MEDPDSHPPLFRLPQQTPKKPPQQTKTPANCQTCRDFQPGVVSETDPASFIRSAESCPRCAVILQALDAVTDIRRPEFTSLELECEGKWLPKGVVQVRCKQEGVPQPEKLGNAFEDPFPNRYRIYTPRDAGAEYALPWLGVRDNEEDSYREHLSSLDERLALARSWLEECRANHKSCSVPQPEFPRRLLDISSSLIRLIEYPSRRDYAALSYCWGPSGNLKTLTTNIRSHISGIPLDGFPPTLADAVKISRAMGQNHLWIDALCIVQDNPDDWLSQIPLMASIYSGAAFVISAQASATVADGCIRFGPASNAPLKRIDVDIQVEGAQRVAKLSIQEEDMPYFNDVPGHHSTRPTGSAEDLLPLNHRAWAFQERFLANRILFCTASELSWQCSEVSRCECIVEPREVIANVYGDFFHTGQLAPILQSESERPSEPLKLHGLWCEVVRHYSARKLTVWTDRLAALQGAVEGLSRNLPGVFKPDEYVFGFWRPFLSRSLSWHRNTLSPCFGDEAVSLRGYAPSWSWVACPGPTEYYGYEWDAGATPLVEVIDVSAEYSTPMGTFGPGKARLTVRGHLIPVRRDLDTIFGDEKMYFEFPRIFYRGGNLLLDAPDLEMEADDPADEDAWRRVTHFLPLMRGEGSPVTQGIFIESLEGGKVFKRVGYAYDYGCVIPWLEVGMQVYEAVVTLV
ncbi:hypothetical protein ACJZ2D_013735 [Fusarium nematophilum]